MDRNQRIFVPYDEKLRLGNQAIVESRTCRDIWRQSGVPYRSIERYSAKVRQGLPIFAGSGRPCFLDDEDTQILAQFINSQRTTLRRKDAIRKLRELKDARYRIRHRITDLSIVGPKLSWRTEQRYYMKAIGLSLNFTN